MANVLQAIITEARRIEEDSIYSAKGHWEAARTWNGTHFAIGIPTTLLAALSAGSAFAKETVTAGILAAFVTATTALLTFLRPSDRASAHTKAGNAYKALHNRTRIFREVDCANASASDAGLAESLKALANERDELNQKSPIIPRHAFIRARKRIEEGETRYAADKDNGS